MSRQLVSAFADHAVVHRCSAVVVDRNIPPAVAALLGCAMSTGYGAIARTAGVGAGEPVGVFGLRGVGLAAVTSARAWGADPIIAVDPLAEKHGLPSNSAPTRRFHHRTPLRPSPPYPPAVRTGLLEQPGLPTTGAGRSRRTPGRW